jgi:hypothetical protein
MNLLTYMDLIAENVIRPATPADTASSYAPRNSYASQNSFGPGVPLDLFSPQGVRLDLAAGGFNSIIEFSAGACLRTFGDTLALDVLDLMGAGDFSQILKSQTNPFISPALNELKAGTIPTSWLGEKNLSLVVDDFQPLSLEFQDPHRLLIRYRADIGVGGTPIQAPPAGAIFTLFDPTIYEEIAKTINVGNSPNQGTTLVPAVLVLQPNSMPRISARQMGPTAFAHQDAHGHPSPSGSSNSGNPHLGSLTGPFPTVYFEISCNYSFTANDALTRLQVFADLSSATLTVTGDADIIILYNAGLFGANGLLLKNYVLQKPQVALAPEISLVGIAASNAAVTELPRFDPAVFHVSNPGNTAQALVAVFNLKPGSDGVAEQVQHFIGNYQYGIISDEYLLERLFKYKWRMNGFFRQFPLSQSIKVQRNSHLENASLVGYLDLDTLDVVSMEIDSNSGKDVFKFGGSGSVHTDYIELVDGTKLYSPDTSQVNFGDPKTATWVFASAIDIVPVLPTAPLLRQFQTQAYADAFQYIGRPFSIMPGAEIGYVRLQAVTNQVYMLGSFIGFY